MEKRGLSSKSQVTIFIIIAIVLVGTGAIAYYLTKTASPTDKYFLQSDVKPGYDNVINSIHECMKMTCMDSLDLVGIQGGYYNEPQEYFDLGWAILPYYYKEGSFLMPSNTVIQNELSAYVDDNLNYCLDSINVSNFGLSYTKPKTKAVISDGMVKFSIDMPISIRKADKTARLELKDDSISQSSKIYQMIEIAKYITDSHKEDPDMICISCVADMARARNLYVDMLDFGDNSTTLVVVSTNQTEMYPAVFEFLNKYPEKS